MRTPKAKSLDIKCPKGQIWDPGLGHCVSIIKGESLYKSKKYEPDFTKIKKK